MTNENSIQGSFDMPRYRSHKVVRAGKIKDMVANTVAENSDVTLHLDFGGNTGAPIQVSAEYMGKHQPKVDGYFVLYDDGYESYSPPEPFEAGYSRLSD